MSNVPDIYSERGALAIHKGLERVADYAQSAWSENTIRAYKGAWDRFVRWCEDNDLESQPAHHRAVMVYLVGLADAGLSVSTVQVALAAINHAHKLGNAMEPGAHAEVKLTMRGIRRRAPRENRARPLLADQIKSIIRELGNSVRDKRDRALLTVGFAGAFRRSEIVELNWDDIEFDEERGAVIYLRQSKTDQEGHGRIVTLAYGARRSTCPVRNLKAWQTLCEDSGIVGGPVWLSIYGRTPNLRIREGARMHAEAVHRLVKRGVGLIDGESKGYSAHSLRAGFVTEAFRRGKPLEVIMRQTGHKSSDTTRRYIREEEAWRDNPSEDVGL